MESIVIEHFQVKYCHMLWMGSVTNKITWVWIGYRIYSLWRL
jgi:hypothetical protein